MIGERATAVNQRLWAGLLAVALLPANTVVSQEELTEGPRIGLALSGGAALGTAHVGVLKVLEELHVPIHFVAGTSMGAIVGGMYAAGLSPAEMEQTLYEIEWRSLLDDRPPRRELPYRQKVDDQTFLARFEVGFNHGSFQLPSGLISGQQLDFALQAMALRTAGIDDFDRLPIPFRAVATDAETGEMVVLDHGDLARAIRASMSIPAVFSPVEIDGKLLVDGGLSRNLPVDVVRAMGADIVIAVDVGQPLPGREELVSLGRMTGQVLGLQSRRNVQEQASLADVVIRPELEEYSAFQFEKAAEMVPRGEEAARRAADALRRLSASGPAFAAYLAEVRRPVPPPGTVSSIQLSTGSSADPRFVLDRVRTRPGDAFDLEAIRLDLKRLYESGDYDKVGFSLSKDDDSDGYGLHIEAHEKPWGPNYLRFGVNLFADLEGESSFDLLASYRMTKLNRLRGELKVAVQLGETPGIRGEFYQPLTRGQTWFIAPWLSESTATIYTPVEEGLLARYRATQAEGGLDLGLQLGKYGELRAGLFRRTGTAELREGADLGRQVAPPSELDLDAGGYRLAATIDQWDDMNFPRRGYFGFLGYFGAREGLGSQSDFDQLTVFLGGAATRKRHTALGLLYLYSALGSDSPVLTSLGGLFRLSGYQPGSIVGRYGGSAALLYLFRLAQLPAVLGDGVYIGGSFEAGNLWERQDQVSARDLRYSGSLVISVDTALGPLYFALGFDEDGTSATYVYVGRTF